MFDEFNNQEAEVQLEAKIEEKKEQEIQPEEAKAGVQLQEEGLKPASVPFGKLLLWSFIASFFSVANPLFASLATNLQTQNLYAGCPAIFSTLYSWNFPFSVYLSNDWKKGSGAATASAFLSLGHHSWFWWPVCKYFCPSFYYVEPKFLNSLCQ